MHTPSDHKDYADLLQVHEQFSILITELQNDHKTNKGIAKELNLIWKENPSLADWKMPFLVSVYKFTLIISHTATTFCTTNNFYTQLRRPSKNTPLHKYGIHHVTNIIINRTCWCLIYPELQRLL